MPLTSPDRPPDPVRQLSLFGAEAADPSVADLAGLLAGPGEVSRMGGTARLSIVLDAAWRVHVLVAELSRRGVAATWEATADGRHLVRTSYASTLAPLALAWLRDPPSSVAPPSSVEPASCVESAGEVKRPPAGFHLNGRRLRLWVAAAGAADPPGFLLRLGAADEHCREPVGAALAAVGLPAVLLDAQAGGPAYRITGRRRLARLADLIGDRPPAAADWPAAP
ncbi:hypothetical protein GA0070558_11218 [Micromonospora haikouensis]|uniref:Uncharacterized protein n=1 Tax=Micromonospora haikouensis TaxID=686309 RepID=A0A1C4VY63_9ACTN|nr:hypothetical protein [Micromonospora haikouensis]SCE88785.1 hypothetical protein GA0070558_11218 [Micromonospora haikouensis]